MRERQRQTDGIGRERQRKREASIQKERKKRKTDRQTDRNERQRECSKEIDIIALYPKVRGGRSIVLSVGGFNPLM